MNTRIVTLFSTKGGKQKVETDATTWGELKPLVEEHYDLSNLQPTENVNKTTLTHQDAVLPEGEFVLFLRPVKTKSGIDGVENLGFRDLRALVTTDDIKSHLNNQVSGKNWTQLGTDDLRAGLASYELPQSNAPQVEEIETVSEEVSADTPTQRTPLDKAKQVKQLLLEICNEVDDDDVYDRVEMLEDDVDGLIFDLEDIYSPEAAAAKRAEEEENAKLEEEFDEFMDGF
jgi:hypothetical protein